MNSEIDFTASLDCEALFSSKNQLKLTSYSPFPVIDFIGGKPRFPNLEEKLLVWFGLVVKIGLVWFGSQSRNSCQDCCHCIIYDVIFSISFYNCSFWLWTNGKKLIITSPWSYQTGKFLHHQGVLIIFQNLAVKTIQSHFQGFAICAAVFVIWKSRLAKL